MVAVADEPERAQETDAQAGAFAAAAGVLAAAVQERAERGVAEVGGLCGRIGGLEAHAISLSWGCRGRVPVRASGCP